MAPRTSSRHSSRSSATSGGVARPEHFVRVRASTARFFEDPDADEARRLVSFRVNDRSAVDAVGMVVRNVDDQHGTLAVPDLKADVLERLFGSVCGIKRGNRRAEAGRARSKIVLDLIAPLRFHLDGDVRDRRRLPNRGPAISRTASSVSTPQRANLLRKPERALEQHPEVRIEIRSNCKFLRGDARRPSALDDMIVDDAIGELDGPFDDPPVSARSAAAPATIRRRPDSTPFAAGRSRLHDCLPAHFSLSIFERSACRSWMVEPDDFFQRRASPTGRARPAAPTSPPPRRNPD